MLRVPAITVAAISTEYKTKWQLPWCNYSVAFTYERHFLWQMRRITFFAGTSRPVRLFISLKKQLSRCVTASSRLLARELCNYRFCARQIDGNFTSETCHAKLVANKYEMPAIDCWLRAPAVPHCLFREQWHVCVIIIIAGT